MLEMEQPENGSTNLGKFKDAESLMKAYSNLEAEFTKKSQRLSQLESEREQENLALAQQEKLEREVEDFVNNFPTVKPYLADIKANVKLGQSVENATLKIIANNFKSAEEFINDEAFLNNYVYNNQHIRDAIIKDYLNKLTQNAPVKIDVKSGNIPLTPPSAPSTISEASKLAKTIIKQI